MRGMLLDRGLKKMKKSAFEMNTLIFVILGIIALVLLIILAIGIKDAGFNIFEQIDSILK